MLLFGPVAVLPGAQGRGYGSALISFTLERAKELGWPCVIITGDPGYYSRFGFEPASRYGIYSREFGRGEAPGLSNQDSGRNSPAFCSGLV